MKPYRTWCITVISQRRELKNEKTKVEKKVIIVSDVDF